MSAEPRQQVIGEFLYREIVEIIAQPDRVSQQLAGRFGFVVGCSDFDSPDTGEREYAVHVNEYGEAFAIPRRCLRGTGQSARADEIVSRTRLTRRVTHRT